MATAGIKESPNHSICYKMRIGTHRCKKRAEKKEKNVKKRKKRNKNKKTFKNVG